MDIQMQFYEAIGNNDINNVELLLKNEKVNPSKDTNYSIRLASKNGFFDIVKLLLNDKKVNPTDRSNCPILFAYQRGHSNVVDLLWQDKRVKDTLKVDDIDLYNELIKKDQFKEKVEKF